MKRKSKHKFNPTLNRTPEKCCEWCLWLKEEGEWEQYVAKERQNDCCCYVHNNFEITMVKTEDAAR